MTPERVDRLANLEAHWRRVQRLASIGSWESDFVSGLLAWSEEVYRIYEVDPALFQPTREAFRRFVHPDDWDDVTAAVETAKRTGRPYQIVHRVVVTGGRSKYLREYAEVVRDSTGEVVGLTGVVQDITAFRKLEEQFLQAQKLDSVGRLAGGIAHDFNNLLQVINGYADILLGSCEEGDPRREIAGLIRDAGDRAASLTQQLLAFSRKQMTQPKLLDMNHVVAENERILKRIIGEDILLETNLHNRPCLVHADAGQMHQMILNLAVNARDAMPQGGHLLIGTSVVEEDGVSWVELCVSDSGCGMTDEVKRHLFEPFFTTKGRGAGTGLGLATVYGIVQQHGGQIGVSSKVDAGSCFRILLPRAPDSAQFRTRPGEQTAQAEGGGERILVVEDDTDVRRLTCVALKMCGYEPVEAPDAAAALRIGETEGAGISLVLSDIVMPGMSGIELLNRLREMHPHLRFILMSGYTESEKVDEVLERGDATFLAKPFSLPDLARHVAQSLRSA